MNELAVHCAIDLWHAIKLRHLAVGSRKSMYQPTFVRLNAVRSKSVQARSGCCNANLTLYFFDRFLNEKSKPGSRRDDMSTRAVGIERNNVIEIDGDVVTIDVGQLDPHGPTSLFD